MQPYFLPYIGYWQLINSVDIFVIYDNIQYTKKGWFNRNRLIKNGKDALFSVSLKKDNDYLNVDERFISNDFDRKKLIAQFKNSYAKAPHIKEIMPLLEEIINFDEDNLFKYIYNSVTKICEYLEIETKILVSSSIDIDHNLKAEKKVLAICEALSATAYINPIGGIDLYSKDKFKSKGLDLRFIKSDNIEYKQFNNDFIPWLSIIDVLMFNNKEETKKMIKGYELI